MYDQGDILETALRGGAGGVSFLLAIILATRASERTPALGALFSFAVGVYVLLSGEATRTLFGAAEQPAIIISILGAVFFWWFAASLFDDDFRWRWWRFAPAIFLPAAYVVREVAGQGALTTTLLVLHIGANALLFADALRLAVATAGDDLVDPRRRFRAVFVTTVGIFGIGIATAEMVRLDDMFSDEMRLFHAGAILALNLIFGSWMATSRSALFADVNAPSLGPRRSAPTGETEAPVVAAADLPAYEKLMALMKAGVYREDGLSVAALAEKVGVREHQLRKLINTSLGFRNFSGFLNTWRIEEAKSALADPRNARRQVLQIALDLGYGSIAPFNRAFKKITGLTPTDYRKQALETGAAARPSAAPPVAADNG